MMPGVRPVRFLKCTKQMGLHIHSLGQLQATVERAYYVYLLDYGRHEPLGAAERGADAAEQDAEHVAGEARVVGQEGADPLRQGEHPLGDGQRRQDVVDEVAATSTMRRALQEGQTPRPLQEKATSRSAAHASRRSRPPRPRLIENAADREHTECARPKHEHEQRG